jgi:hypothetical protein
VAQQPGPAWSPAYTRLGCLLVLVSATTLPGGCGAVCRGPGCEAQWPNTRVSVLRGDDLRRSTDVWSDAVARFDGNDTHGAPWAVGMLGRTLLFGQPDARQVLRTPYREGRGSWERLDRWTGPEGFGAALGTADFNGDGELDLLVGAPDTDFDRGAAYLFRSAIQGTADAEAAALEIRGGAAGDRLGEQIAICGDVTGDGLPDALVSMTWLATPDHPSFDGRQVPDLGGGVVLLRSEALGGMEGVTEPWSLGPTWWGEQVGAGAGRALVCDRDLTGDGVVDLVIGAPFHDGEAGADSGRTYILDGAVLPATSPLGEAAIAVLEGTAGAWLGMSLTTLDLDGVAPAELAVGAPGFAEGIGRVVVYAARPLTRRYTPEPVFSFARDGVAPDHFGRWIAEGDLDGDGISDLVVGAPDLQDGGNGYDTGRAWVFRGGNRDLWLPEDTDLIADERVLGSEPFSRVGRAPLLVDLDDDGLDELVLATRRASKSQ